ncbi:MAG TPA: alpha/beta hydrolase-fold protein [Candidatus Dormibacteraeota bacterium]|nr:alpha/beta hydrolase-fold protein [Candidatus Dormibacteraeota bacterium]
MTRLRLRPAGRILWPAARLIAVSVAGLLLIGSGFGTDTGAALVVMGFSPDRASLLTGLLMEFLLVAGGTLALADPRSAVLAAVGVFVAFYSGTFFAETENAMHGSTAGASFDPVGWGLTVLTLAATVSVVGVSVALLAGAARRRIAAAISDLRAIGRGDRAPDRFRGPVVVATALAAIFVAAPILGDMLNYEPDVHMRADAKPGTGLTGSSPDATVPPVTSGLSEDIFNHGGVVGSAGNNVTSILSAARPWLAWKPSGAGTVEAFSMPAPWVGLPSNTQISVYLPPGYATTAAHYPVVYEVPHAMASWITSANLPSQMDALIDSGAIPAEIVVFVWERGGPYPDSECANSIDGREWFETWLVTTVVPTIDARYRTIASPAARSVMGFSQGGYCAPMLTLRHPDVFSTAIAFSGYFQAGVRSSETPNAWRPYGGNQSAENQVSPLLRVLDFSNHRGASLFFELSADTHEAFFGPQVRAFTAALQGSGIPFVVFPTHLGHAWAAVRAQIAVVLETLAQRQSALGVFSR